MFKANKFFFILLLCSTLILSVVLIRFQTKTYSKASTEEPIIENIHLTPGWNFVSFTVNPQMTLKELCTLFPSGLEAHVYRYNNMYEGGSCQLPNSLPDQDLSGYRAYFIFVNDNFSLRLTGSTIPPIYSLDSNFAGVGLPVKEDKIVYAHDFCGKYARDQRDVLQIFRWINGAWDPHICSNDNVNNFEIKKNEGYFVNSETIQKTKPEKLSKPPTPNGLENQ